MNKLTALALLGGLAGCGDSTSNGIDLAGTGGQDLAAPRDGSTKADLSTGGGGDMARTGGDMATSGGGDMATSGGGDMATGGGPDGGALPAFNLVVTVILENTSYTSVVGDKQTAPFLNSLMNYDDGFSKGALGTNYQDSGSHPSLPNYLYMTSGNTQYPGFLDISPTTTPFPVAADNIGNQLETAGVNWRAYMESMGTACNTSDNSPYAAKHNPFVYYQDIVGNKQVCNNRDVDFSKFGNDLSGGTYRYMWITPNLNSDGHDTDLMTADAWCMTNLAPILTDKRFRQGGVLFITWDEGEGLLVTDDHVPMIVVSPFVKTAGLQVATAYTHANFLATVEDIFGVKRLGAAVGIKPMSDFFQ
jgi:hypothetical protein